MSALFSYPFLQSKRGSRAKLQDVSCSASTSSRLHRRGHGPETYFGLDGAFSYTLSSVKLQRVKKKKMGEFAFALAEMRKSLLQVSIINNDNPLQPHLLAARRREPKATWELVNTL